MADYAYLVKTLRYTADIGVPDFTNSKIMREAADAIEALVKERDQERAVRQTVEFHSEERWQKVAGANLIAANNALAEENAKLREALKAGVHLAAADKDLSDEVTKLREALKPFAKEAERYDPDDGDGDFPIWSTPRITIAQLRNARAALGKE